jgi:hypothetical protein
LYQYRGQPELAKPWHDQALKADHASATLGEVQYYHHLAGFYADVLQAGNEAVKWARLDLALRPGFASHDSLGWALYRAGEFTEELKEIKLALAPGFKDAHLYYHAEMIGLAAGDETLGKEMPKLAAQTNPLFESFHVHR